MVYNTLVSITSSKYANETEKDQVDKEQHILTLVNFKSTPQAQACKAVRERTDTMTASASNNKKAANNTKENRLSR